MPSRLRIYFRDPRTFHVFSWQNLYVTGHLKRTPLFFYFVFFFLFYTRRTRVIGRRKCWHGRSVTNRQKPAYACRLVLLTNYTSPTKFVYICARVCVCVCINIAFANSEWFHARISEREKKQRSLLMHLIDLSRFNSANSVIQNKTSKNTIIFL